MANWPFWIALSSQLVIVFGYFWFYRKEQLCMWDIRCNAAVLTRSFYSSTINPILSPHELIHCCLHAHLLSWAVMDQFI